MTKSQMFVRKFDRYERSYNTGFFLARDLMYTRLVLQVETRLK